MVICPRHIFVTLLGGVGHCFAWHVRVLSFCNLFYFYFYYEYDMKGISLQCCLTVNTSSLLLVLMLKTKLIIFEQQPLQKKNFNPLIWSLFELLYTLLPLVPPSTPSNE